MTSAIKAKNLTVGYNDKRVINRLDLNIEANQITCLLGANGCGKSTLLQALSGLLSPSQGEVYLFDQPLHSLTNKQRALRLAFLAQQPQAPNELTVRELVMLGRYPYQKMFCPPSSDDQNAVNTALEQTEISAFANQALGKLSGGQRQRAWIAMVLAQQSEILLLDEPASYLDLAHQYELLKLVKQLNREQGKTIVMVLHDLNQAIEIADQLVLLKEGRLVAQGSPEVVLSESLIEEVFGLRCYLVPNPKKPFPLLIPV